VLPKPFQLELIDTVQFTLNAIDRRRRVLECRATKATPLITPHMIAADPVHVAQEEHTSQGGAAGLALLLHARHRAAAGVLAHAAAGGAAAGVLGHARPVPSARQECADGLADLYVACSCRAARLVAVILAGIMKRLGCWRLVEFLGLSIYEDTKCLILCRASHTWQHRAVGLGDGEVCWRHRQPVAVGSGWYASLNAGCVRSSAFIAVHLNVIAKQMIQTCPLWSEILVLMLTSRLVAQAVPA